MDINALNMKIQIPKEAITNISMERINSEFCKTAMADNFSVVLREYKDVFSQFIPELKDTFDFPQNNPYHSYDVFEHTLHALDAYACDCASDLAPRDLVTILAILFHDIGKPYCYQDGEDGIRHFKGHGKVSATMTDEILRRMKSDNDTREKVVELISYHDTTFDVGTKYVKRWLSKIGEEQFRRLLNLRRADIKGQSSLNQETRLQKIDNIENLLNEVSAENSLFYFGNIPVVIKKEYPIGNLVEIKGIGDDFRRVVSKSALTKMKQREATISLGLFHKLENEDDSREENIYKYD